MFITETAIGALAGMLNACGGGGAFVLFPALLWLGAPPIIANATTGIVMIPGSLAILLGYRNELLAHKKSLFYFSAISLFGGILGAFLLLKMSNNAFLKIVPSLLLFAVFLLTFKNRLRAQHARKVSFYHPFVMLALTLCAIYNAFFGAGTGILLFALFSLTGMQNMHEMNSLRALIGFVSNVVSLIIFIQAGLVAWAYIIPMSIGAFFGGYFGVRLLRLLPNHILNYLVIAIAWFMTLGIFLKIYWQ